MIPAWLIYSGAIELIRVGCHNKSLLSCVFHWEPVAMIEKLTKTDIGILIASAAMAFGAFCPLIKLPIVGSLNYFMNGRGDGIFVVGCSAAIVACVTFGYRRTAGLLASGALVMTLMLLVRFSSLLSEAQKSLPKDDKGLFGALGKVVVESVGFEWGWLFLIGGPIGVVILAFFSPFDTIVRTPEMRDHHTEDRDSFSAADKIIADYLENRKISPAIRNQSTSQQPVFGKRG
jgi:hypothetical protein